MIKILYFSDIDSRLRERYKTTHAKFRRINE